jgi:hypothetical protein
MKRILLVLAIGAMPLAAQQPRMGHEEHSQSAMAAHMEEMMAPMMGVMAFRPDQLLARKDSLNLTPQQVARLTGLQDAAQHAHERCAADAKPHVDAITQGLRAAATDTAALQQHFQGAHEAMRKAHGTMFTIAVQARALLTTDQRARVEEWASRNVHETEHH